MLTARRYPHAKTIHLVMDNLSSHTLASLTKHYGKDDGRALWSRFTVHYTPKHGSWLRFHWGFTTKKARATFKCLVRAGQDQAA